ncbi:hypothetical protein [Humisphaera borealis]|uniref:Uncharacterized protein n=1 Tax=Humisphaera borealis TaxID=2807512 RepID=A0A7M2WY67_9BACT|nr:hypothetical protein [Humisphaera borealis]QOV89761.1 hypothetical protein IPV69_26860 [Humisphaera borealis]
MSIIPVSRLSMSDLSRLGNNLRYAENAASNYEPDADERDRKAERRRLAPLNRSLASVGERIDGLTRD